MLHKTSVQCGKIIGHIQCHYFIASPETMTGGSQSHTSSLKHFNDSASFSLDGSMDQISFLLHHLESMRLRHNRSIPVSTSESLSSEMSLDNASMT